MGYVPKSILDKEKKLTARFNQVMESLKKETEHPHGAQMAQDIWTELNKTKELIKNYTRSKA